MIRACTVDELPPGESVRIPGSPAIAVFNTEDGELYAIDDTCTHQDASLADGWLEGCFVECPLHAASFVGTPVRRYPVVVEDGVIHVDTRSREAVA